MQGIFNEIQEENNRHWEFFNKLMYKFENTPFIEKAPKEIVTKEFEKLKDRLAIITTNIKRMEKLI